MIYHYTSIENLALILNSQKIRFTRLDKVDDIEESTEYKKINVSKFLFVSCWTKTQEENIALWKMYTPNMKGVRIGLPNPPFKMKRVNNQSTSKIDIIGDFMLPLSPDEWFGDNYFVTPFFNNPNLFYKDIEYLKDSEMEDRYKNMIEITKNDDNTQTMKAKAQDFAKIKHDRWKFQEESRFVLFIMHQLKDPNDPNEMISKLFQEVSLPFTHFDIDLDINLFKDMELTMGPNCNEADKILVGSLCERYGISKGSKDSNLKNKIRF